MTELFKSAEDIEQETKQAKGKSAQFLRGDLGHFNWEDMVVVTHGLVHQPETLQHMALCAYLSGSSSPSFPCPPAIHQDLSLASSMNSVGKEKTWGFGGKLCQTRY